LEALSKPELTALLAAARAHRERDWLMILTAFWHGLRASEVVALTASSIADGHLTVQRLKGSKRTVQPLMQHPDPLLNEAAALIEYTREMHANQRLFPITRERFWQLVQQHGRTAEIPKRLCHPHILKHSFAQQFIQSIGVENVRTYLGHKSGASTLEYLKRSDAEAAASVQRAVSE
jgi:integrase